MDYVEVSVIWHTNHYVAETMILKEQLLNK